MRRPVGGVRPSFGVESHNALTTMPHCGAERRGTDERASGSRALTSRLRCRRHRQHCGGGRPHLHTGEWAMQSCGVGGVRPSFGVESRRPHDHMPHVPSVAVLTSEHRDHVLSPHGCDGVSQRRRAMLRVCRAMSRACRAVSRACRVHVGPCRERLAPCRGRVAPRCERVASVSRRVAPCHGVSFTPRR